jgi:hypothetical protein
MLTPRFSLLTLMLSLASILGLATLVHQQGSTISLQHRTVQIQELYIQELEGMVNECTSNGGSITPMPSSKTLLKAYQQYNRQYWGNALPPINVVWNDHIWPEEKQYGNWDPSNDTISVAKQHRPYESLWRATLLHEMAHVATKDEKQDHGPLFRKEMRRLMRLGAFDDLL